MSALSPGSAGSAQETADRPGFHTEGADVVTHEHPICASRHRALRICTINLVVCLASLIVVVRLGWTVGIVIDAVTTTACLVVWAIAAWRYHFGCPNRVGEDA